MAEIPQRVRMDSHHHLWHYTPEEYGWIDGTMKLLRRNFLLNDLKQVLREANVDGAVAVQARQSEEETRWLLELAQSEDSSIRGVVGWLPIAADHFPAMLEKYQTVERLCGLRHVVQAEPSGFLEGTAFNRGIRTMKDSGLVYDILIYAPQLAEAIHFVDRHPEQSFVVDHMAKPDIRGNGFAAWDKGFRALAERENVSCKLSGMVTEADWTAWSADTLRPYFETALEAFGPKRLMMGSDWPVMLVASDYAQWWRTVEGWIAGLTEDEQAEILGGTANRVYRLQT